MNKKILIVLMSLGLSAQVAAQAPIPDKLLNAKTAFLVNDGTWFKAYDKFYGEFKKWNRFQLVQSKEEADIVIVLSNSPSNSVAGVSIPSTPGAGSGIFVGASESKFYMRIMDAKDGAPLWADAAGEAFLLSNSPKKLVSNLRKRMGRK